MKRTLFVLIGIALIACLVLAACENVTSNDTPSLDGSIPSVYETMSGLFAKDYARIMLDLSATTDGETLCGQYDVTKKGDDTYSVTYRYEQLSAFAIGADGTISAPDAYKTTYSGRATIEDGRMTSQEGAPLDVELSSVTASNFRFEEGMFAYVQLSEGRFVATVTDASAFAGIAGATDMSLTILYTANALSSVTLSYTKADTVVSATYTFA